MPCGTSRKDDTDGHARLQWDTTMFSGWPPKRTGVVVLWVEERKFVSRLDWRLKNRTFPHISTSETLSVEQNTCFSLDNKPLGVSPLPHRSDRGLSLHGDSRAAQCRLGENFRTCQVGRRRFGIRFTKELDMLYSHSQKLLCSCSDEMLVYLRSGSDATVVSTEVLSGRRSDGKLVYDRWRCGDSPLGISSSRDSP